MAKCKTLLSALGVLVLVLADMRVEARDRKRPKPNIIFIMADDLGWNDVGFHNPKVKTPNIDRLARMGIELTQHYVQPVCSPTRASLMTGKYAHNTGLQQIVIEDGAKNCLPTEHKLMPEFMRDRGYATKYVGKWHLGNCNLSCLPTHRGFDEYKGIIGGASDYFTWEYRGAVYRYIGDQPSIANIGTHHTVQEGRDVRDMLNDHDPKVPLFMVISPTAAHTPLQVTEEMFNVHDFLSDTGNNTRKRREYLGLVSALDDVVGITIDTLTERKMLQNSIIVFTSDNGGTSLPLPLPGFDAFASNYPLRNSKTSYHEGGVRVPTIYYNPQLKSRTQGTKRDFLMHVSDWLPTFAAFAQKRLKRRQLDEIDGISQMSNLRNRINSKYAVRSEMVIGLSNFTAGITDSPPCSNTDGSYRWRDWKLLNGSKTALFPPPPGVSEWQIPIESPHLSEVTGDSCVRVDENGNSVVECLFNIANDPYEQKNLYNQNPNLVRYLLRKLKKADNSSVKNTFTPRVAPNKENSKPLGDFLVIRNDYCQPAVDFPLLPQPQLCRLNI